MTAAIPRAVIISSNNRKEHNMRSLRTVLLGLVGLIGIATAAFALTVPATFSPRQFQTQQTHYLRFTVNFNSCVLASGSCTFKVGAVPYNSFMIRGYQQIITSFNSLSTDTIAIGVTSTNGNELVAAQSVHGASGGATTLTIVSTAAGTVVTGDGATSTGTDGGFDIWVKYAQTGTAPTAGQAVEVLEYFAPNDGSCAPVPLGSTAPAC
jgi:hypothetical protein